MIGMISRLVEQKGLDIILESLATLVSYPVQLMILGTGETHYEIELSEWAQRYPEQFKVTIGYNESLAHKIEAGSDIYLMPSTFEPCGLNQLSSLCYGTLPVVTPVGGLADSVTDASEENIKNRTANGFMLKERSAVALLAAIQQALALYQQPEIWRQLQVNAMSGDFSWKVSAERYIALYQQALDERE
jgi:starch synthase